MNIIENNEELNDEETDDLTNVSSSNGSSSTSTSSNGSSENNSENDNGDPIVKVLRSLTQIRTFIEQIENEIGLGCYINLPNNSQLLLLKLQCLLLRDMIKNFH